MRIWQRRAIACTRTPERSVIVSANVRVGVAVYRSAVAPVQPKIRSAISVLQLRLEGPVFQPGAFQPGALQPGAFQRERTLSQAIQERREGAPDLRAAVKPLPQEPERSEERRVGKECRSRWSPY